MCKLMHGFMACSLAILSDGQRWTKLHTFSLSPRMHLLTEWEGCWTGKYLALLKTGLGILDFYHSDWLNGARLLAHIPAVTKYGQGTLNNKMNKVSWKLFPRQQPGEKNRQEKSLGNEFELSRNSNSVTKSVV